MSGSLIEASLDPAGWFGRRGVKRIVRLRPGSPEADGIPIEPSPDADMDRPKIMPKILPDPGENEIVDERREGFRAKSYEIVSGSSIVLQTPSGLLDWILIPHVTPAPKENVAAFKKAIRIALELRPGSKLTSKRLLKGISETKTRKKMKDCYESIIVGGSKRLHNRISMSLYSGPMGRDSGPMGQAHLARWRSEIMGLQWSSSYKNRNSHYFMPTGWLGTGDATLKNQCVWESFEATYRNVRDQIATIVLPHHGSKHNFRTELLNFATVRNAIASASNPSRYKHPSPTVMYELQHAGVTTWQVSQDVNSELEEIVWHSRLSLP